MEITELVFLLVFSSLISLHKVEAARSTEWNKNSYNYNSDARSTNGELVAYDLTYLLLVQPVWAGLGLILKEVLQRGAHR